MKELAIKVKGLGKKYTIGLKRDSSLRGTIANLFSSKKSKGEDFWALRNIDFEIEKGDIIGIIGKNGAGKSTLLKVLSKITKPTEGRIEFNGRIASLLEVGTGFHPELTGRENIFLNGTILGMTRKEVQSKLDEIVAFSGIEKFMDTPVKRYSSGMYVRLAFAVAAHLEPEILIVDEVLAVGDAEFQKKCLGKMKNIAGQGRTVLFVSHNMAAVKSLCNKGMLLEKGQVIFNGPSTEAVQKYFSRGKNTTGLTRYTDVFKEDLFRLNSIQVTVKGKNDDEPIDESDEIVLSTDIDFHSSESERYTITYHVNNDMGETLFSISASETKTVEGNNVFECVFPSNFFLSGMLTFSLFIVEDKRAAVFVEKEIFSFNIVDAPRELGVHMGREPGIIKSPGFEWRNKSV